MSLLEPRAVARRGLPGPRGLPTPQRVAARWYVRSQWGAGHPYDDRVAASPGKAWCRRCLAIHARPLSVVDWHIESDGVDAMLCGVRIDLEEGEVRTRPAKNVCQECLAISEEVSA